MKKIFLLIAVSLVAFSCLKGEEKGDVSPGLFFQKISQGPDNTNALRQTIEVDMKKLGNVHVEYWAEGDTKVLKSTVMVNEIKPKFSLLFMEAEKNYNFVVKAEAGDQRTCSDVYTFKTRKLPSDIANYSLVENEFKFDGYVFITQRMSEPGYLLLINDKAHVVWYQALAPNLSATNYDTVSKTFTCLIGGDMNSEAVFVADELATVDVYGKTVFRRNRSAIGGKLFHHDVRLMPDGNYIGINFVKKPFDLTMWGGSAQEIVTGDGYTIFDKAGTVIKEWDCFGTMNPQDDPTIMDKFPMLNINKRDDWLHSNAIEICPDGNYIMSMNMISQIWKINSKTGETMWRLGVNGNVTIPANLIQNMEHSCNITKDGDLMFYDNSGGPGGCSRVISYKIDDASKSAIPTLTINLPMDMSSGNQSSAYMLDKDHVIFGSTVPATIGITDKTGKLVWRVIAPHQFFRAQYIDKIEF